MYSEQPHLQLLFDSNYSLPHSNAKPINSMQSDWRSYLLSTDIN